MAEWSWPYHRNLFFSAAVFLISGISAIVFQQPLLLLIPFGWILFPLLFEYVVIKPETIFWLMVVMLPLSTEMNVTPNFGFDFPDEWLLVLLTGISIIKIIQRYGSLANAYHLVQGSSARFVAHIGAVGHIVGAIFAHK